MAGYHNPIGPGLSGERVDMGVDYGGSGPLYALGSGTIANLYNSGWPGGTFLTIHLDSGQYVYYAEDIQPLVRVGDKVTAGEHIANATGGPSGIEIGWAAPPGTGETMAAQAGQQSHHGDPGSVATAFGVLMSNLIQSLGGPPGKVSGNVSGSVPSNYGVAASGTPTASASLTSDIFGTGGLFSIPGDIINFFKDADALVTKLHWLFEPSSWLRIGSFFIAIVFLVGAIVIFTKADTKINVSPVPVPI